MLYKSAKILIQIDHVEGLNTLFSLIVLCYSRLYSCIPLITRKKCTRSVLLFVILRSLFVMSGQAGLLKPDTVEGTDIEIPEFNVSYKPQKISPKFQNTVRHLLHQKIRDSYMHPQFVSDVMKPLQIEQLMDQEVVNLSGGELQRVAICLCLGKVILLFCLIHCFVCLMLSLIGPI